MTLEEAKRKTLMLLDEYGDGVSVDTELEERITAFLDTAQKRLAQIVRIVRTVVLEREEGQTELPLPGDCMKIYRLWRGNVLSSARYPCRGGKLIVPAGDTAELVLEYFALPRTLDDDTPEDYELEIAPEAAECMPFFAAGQALAADMVQDGTLLLGIYQSMVNDLDTELPGTGGRIRNTMFKG